MAFVWRATFIDEVTPKAVATRAKSEPPARTCSVAFSEERDYVDSLEKKANQLQQKNHGLKPARKLQSSSSRSRSGSRESTASTRSGGSSYVSESRISTWQDEFVATPTNAGVGHEKCFVQQHSEQKQGPAQCTIETRSMGLGPVPAGRVPNGTASCGVASESLPCSPMARSECSVNVSECASRCVRGRAPHLSKPHRDLLKTLAFNERVALMFPMIRRHVGRMNLSVEVKELLHVLRSVASKHQPPSNARRTQLLSALGVLSLRALFTAIIKAPDTPDWLTQGTLKDQLDRIRDMDAAFAR